MFTSRIDGANSDIAATNQIRGFFSSYYFQLVQCNIALMFSRSVTRTEHALKNRCLFARIFYVTCIKFCKNHVEDE